MNTIIMSHSIHYCPLCLQSCPDEYRLTFGHRHYFICGECHLLSVSIPSLPNSKDEKERYLHHQNNEDDPGYVQFLMQIVQPLKSSVSGGSSGLDYGCGPNPVLANLLQKMGFRCDYYDPLFHPHLEDKSYDFITATECFEHFHRPITDVKHILDHLNLGGILAVMTETWSSIEKLADWYYLRDFTHVSLYHHETMLWLCRKFGLELIYTDQKRVYIFKRNNSENDL